MRTGIALGSNLGDRLSHLREARKRLLDLHEGRKPALCSSVFETEPVGCEPEASFFLNAVIEIESGLEPLDLLDFTQQIESDLGRPTVRSMNSPRTIDVDLLYADDHEITSERLCLPHPRMSERRFVLVPLGEIRPDLSLPGMQESISDLIAATVQTDESPPLLFRARW